MGKHYKKGIVYPETAREWLARYESGEALKTIAHNDHFDIRTVKRQVEEAGSERTAKEARQTVLRIALEKHFADLASLAERMRGMVTAGVPITLDPDSTFLLEGLKQHLPRSPLWDYLNEYQARCKKALGLPTKSKGNVRNAPQLSPEALRRVENVLFNEENVHAAVKRPAIKGGVDSHAGCDVIIDSSSTPSEDESKTLTFIELKTISEDEKSSFSDQKTEWQKFRSGSLLKGDSDTAITGLQHKVTQELTTIVLRRVVPGRCRYCPI